MQSVQTQTLAIQYIANHINPSNSTVQTTEDVKFNYVKRVVLDDLLPHMTTKQGKQYYLGYMVQKLLNYVIWVLVHAMIGIVIKISVLKRVDH